MSLTVSERTLQEDCLDLGDKIPQWFKCVSGDTCDLDNLIHFALPLTSVPVPGGQCRNKAFVPTFGGKL